jgi:hypothetical protein
MNWKKFAKKQSWTNLAYCPRIYLEGLRKNMKNLSQEYRSPGRDLKPGHSNTKKEYKEKHKD